MTPHLGPRSLHGAPARPPRVRLTLGWTLAGAWIGVSHTDTDPAGVTVLHQGGPQATLAMIAAQLGWPPLPLAPDPVLDLRGGDVIILDRHPLGHQVDATLIANTGQVLGSARAATFSAALAQLQQTTVRNG
ncbi:hypothetical protein [Deinococcus soli (ex Cha et al. 2016)]|uniref:hypothetical protein n=1 Tax=Deinococcus soli (ex Cha et al. 2016) TaxID=1309411 RepID=UPI00166F5F4F|nr:hypothetical protein [Deinococcus soli (ex Cha et al. 2016)]GGB71087.1 hypothetical protein GCM10008019_29100 [Deinococcus soli (ex Cha et al. 2016)]